VTGEANVRTLREQLGLGAHSFGSLEPRTEVAPLKGRITPTPVVPRPAPVLQGRPRTHDGSRIRLESRIAFLADEWRDEVVTPTRQFSIWETTTRLSSVSREEDERNGRVALGCYQPRA